MFWNDPNLYGVNFPHREFPTTMYPFATTPFTPWATYPRFVPPTFGYNPPYNVPFTRPEFFTPYTRPEIYPTSMKPEMFGPYPRPETFTPWIRPETFTTFNRPEMLKPEIYTPWYKPEFFTPWAHTFNYPYAYNVTLPMYNPYRPFPF